MDTFFGKAYKCYIEYGKLYTKALDSFKSIMQANDVYEVNPYPKYYTDKLIGHNRIRIDWQQTQERVGNWIILFKEK